MKTGELGGYICSKCGVSVCDHYGNRILELERGREITDKSWRKLMEENKRLREALKYVDNWFERMEKEPFDTKIIKEALKESK